MASLIAESGKSVEVQGGTSALMRERNWSGSPLGPSESWPHSLRAVVALLLNSRFPMFLAWGPELVLFYNDAYAEILGSKHPHAFGRRFPEVWPEIWSDIHPIVVQALAGNPSYFENLPLNVVRSGQSEEAWFTFSYSPALDENGDVAGMFCVVAETTLQVQAERYRIAEYERLRGLFQQAPGLIAVLREPNHIFEIANDAFLKLIGHRDILGNPVSEALPELVKQGFVDLLNHVYSTGEPFSGHEVLVQLQRLTHGPLEDRYINFVYQPIRDFQGEITGIFIEGNDVTEAVRATNALQEKENLLRNLANTIPQLAWIADPDGAVHWYNDRWYEYTGISAGELRRFGWGKIIHPDCEAVVLDQWKASVDNGHDFEMSYPIRGADGEYRTFFTRAAPLRDTSGNIVHWFGTNTDVTPLEDAKKELLASNLRKDEFLAMLAHELRNPLAPIATAAEVLKLSGFDEARVRRTCDVISRQVAHMKELVDDLLDVSRVTRGLVTLQDETLSLSSVIADAVEQTAGFMETKCHRFTVLMPEGHFVVRGDRTRLIQVFSNLLNNAAKYTAQGGNITLRLEEGETDVEVIVEDDGIGVRPSLQPYIFELFTQAERTPDRSQGGLGIGLALVKSLVELHRGKVSMHSEGAGKGSVFTVSLPRDKAVDRFLGPTDTESTVLQPFKGFHLLVVDDNIDAADTLSLLLGALGHNVTTTYNPLDALALAKQISPAMLILDIGLPDIDGYELARRLRSNPETAHSVLVALTGYGQAEDKARAIEAGFDYHLVKPVNLGRLQEVLATLV